MKIDCLRCFFCGRRYKPSIRYSCSVCRGSLEVVYKSIALTTPHGFKQGIWRYITALPLEKVVSPVTIGEGDTPLILADRLGKKLGHEHLFLKVEGMNPTLSFKDRAMSVAVTKAIEFKLKRIVAASTGNTAVSASAYAAKAGLECLVYLPAGIPMEKRRLPEYYGAKLVEVEGTFSDAYLFALKQSKKLSAFNVTTTYLNPYIGEGYKTVAYEIFEVIGVPDWIVVPVGAGPLLFYVYKGFLELNGLGCAQKLPRMVAVQAAKCAPIARAYETNREEVSEWYDDVQTLASGVADPLVGYSRDGTRTLSVVRQSNGAAIAVEEEDIVPFMEMLAHYEGICAEPASALPLASIQYLRKKSLLKPDDIVVLIITGHGAKSKLK
jgi:threonine synthase